MPQSPSWRSSSLHPDRHRGLAIPFQRDTMATGGARASSKNAQPDNDHRHHRGREWPVVSSVTTSAAAAAASTFTKAADLQQQSSLHVSGHRDSAVLGSTSTSATNTSTSATNTRHSLFQHSTLNSFPQLNILSPPTPFLTVVLIKLHKVFPDFCRSLVGEKHKEDETVGRSCSPNSVKAASQACRLLDNTVATASQNHFLSTKNTASTSSSITAASSTTQAVANTKQTSSPDPGKPSSPLSFRYWMPSSSSDQQPWTTPQSPTASALALEGEFESFASPLLLLAGAQVMGANFEHLHHPSAPPASLSALYQRIAADLLHTEVLLCEPFLRTSNDNDDNANERHMYHDHKQDPHSFYAEAAASLSVALRCLLVLTNTQLQLLDVQRAVFGVPDGAHPPGEGASSSSSVDLAQAAAAVKLLRQTVEDATAAILAPSPMAARTPPPPLMPSVQTESYDETRSFRQTRNNQNNMAAAAGVSSSDSEPAVMLLVRNLLQELAAWQFCFETCAALERCL